MPTNCVSSRYCTGIVDIHSAFRVQKNLTTKVNLRPYTRSPSPYAAAYLPVADAVCRKVPLILVSLPPSPAEAARAACKEGEEEKDGDREQGNEEEEKAEHDEEGSTGKRCATG